MNRSTQRPTEALTRQLIVSIDRLVASQTALTEVIAELAIRNQEIVELLSDVVEESAEQDNSPRATTLDQLMEETRVRDHL
jgi:hypothetical protein